MKKMRDFYLDIDVTRDDIANGKCRSFYDCMLDLATFRAADEAGYKLVKKPKTHLSRTTIVVRRGNTNHRLDGILPKMVTKRYMKWDAIKETEDEAALRAF